LLVQIWYCQFHPKITTVSRFFFLVDCVLKLSLSQEDLGL
jgi:hypothetical protein